MEYECESRLLFATHFFGPWCFFVFDLRMCPHTCQSCLPKDTREIPSWVHDSSLFFGRWNIGRVSFTHTIQHGSCRKQLSTCACCFSMFFHCSTLAPLDVDTTMICVSRIIGIGIFLTKLRRPHHAVPWMTISKWNNHPISGWRIGMIWVSEKGAPRKRHWYWWLEHQI